MPRGSWPYVILTAAIALGLAVLMVSVMDAAVAEWVAIDAWADGSEATITGRQRVLALWDRVLLIAVTSISISVVWAARRGR